MSKTAPLYRLQLIDSEVDKHSWRLNTVNGLLRETEELHAGRARLATAKDYLTRWHAAQKKQELELQVLQQKKQLSEHQLYAGKIRNPKELTDLQEEIASLDRRMRAVEEKLFEIMLQVEAGEEEGQAAAGSLERIEAEWSSSQAEMRGEKEALEMRLAELATQRQTQVAGIPPADLSGYEHIRGRKGGQAVAILDGAECQGCMTTVSAIKAKEVRSGMVAYCGTCGRILHIR